MTSPPHPSLLTLHDAVFLICFGGPEKPDDIMPFLERVTQGRGIPAARLAEVAKHYEHVGGRSPINEITRRQAVALQNELKNAGSGPQPAALRVYVGQRNWHPLIEDTLRQMQTDGVKRAVGFVTAAHRCEASWERYTQAVAEARGRIGAGAPVIDYVDPWFDHPLFIDAIGARVRESGEAARQAPWYFVAHSIPQAMADHSRYVQELTRTAELVCQKLGKKEFKLAYSSRSGAPQDPWLSPSLIDALDTEKARGERDVLFIPIGFVADHVEVLFDQDVEAKTHAQKIGIGFHRTATVGEHPLFIRMIADMIQHRRAVSVGPHG